MLTMATPTLEKQLVAPNSPAQQSLQTMATPTSAMTTPTDNGLGGASLTVRLIMQGKEVGSIIGKKGEIVKRFRDESGAKINISDGSCPERIVTVTGATDAIYKAFTLICNKFEEDLANLVSPNTVPRPPITFRLIVPASQCGSLIGKGGSKIKEIREVTGASIQVASEMLPNSTERAVTISGNSEAITQCVYHICLVMSESPPKGITVPYRPLKPVTVGSLGTQGATSTASCLPGTPAAVAAAAAAFLPAGPTSNGSGSHNANGLNHAALVPASQSGKLGPIPLTGLSNLNGLAAAAAGFGNSGALNPADVAYAFSALAALAASGHNRPQTSQQTHEMTVPNELIGCIIGKGGSKIAEIRQLSGAMIRISNCEEREPGSNTDRTITMSGNAESVALAQYLINMSMELHKANLEAQTQAAALLSCQSPYGAALAPPQNAPSSNPGMAQQHSHAAAAAAQQMFLLQQQRAEQQQQQHHHHHHLKSLFIPCSTQQPSLAYILKAPLTSSTGTAGDMSAPMSTITTTTPAMAGPIVAAPQPNNPHHPSPLLYHVTPKLKAAGGLVTLTSSSAASRASDHKFSPY